jgi:hypothetical protein
MMNQNDLSKSMPSLTRINVSYKNNENINNNNHKHLQSSCIDSHKINTFDIIKSRSSSLVSSSKSSDLSSGGELVMDIDINNSR